MMPKYRVQITWTATGCVDVVADTKEEAYDYATNDEHEPDEVFYYSDQTVDCIREL